MEMEKWNNKQKELFELFFTDFKNDKSIEMSQLMNIIKPFSDKWKELYNILKENSEDFDNYSAITRIKRIIHNNVEYLIIQTNIWSYLCIDLTSKEIVDFKDNLLPFSEEFFIDNFDERKISNPSLFYHTLSFKKSGLEPLVQYVLDNSLIFSEKNCFNYKRKLGDGFLTSLIFEVDTGKIMIYFGNNQGIVNYLFLNSSLIPIGVSNPTGNKDDLESMSKRVKDINIPVSNIPKYLLDIEKNKEYQKKI